MIIYVNNKSLELAQLENIPKILHLVNIPESNGIAVAVNNAVIPKVDWAGFLIKENDHLTIIRATQGG